VPVYELSRRPEDDQPFYTMRFVRGRTLREAIVEHHARRAAGETDPVERLKLLQAFVNVCQATGYAHSRGVVHRDLKPENVVLGGFGEVVVLDWGLARMVDCPESDDVRPPGLTVSAEARADATLAGTQLGTPTYMAPEQAEGRLDLIDARTDVYGLGGILFEILTGRAPHEGTDAIDILRRVATGPTPRAKAVDPAVPPALDAIAARAMARVRAERYARAADLAEDVQRWLADEPVSAYPEPWSQRIARWTRRHRAAVIAASLVALILTATTWVGVSLHNRQLQQAQRYISNLRVASFVDEQLANVQLKNDRWAEVETILSNAARRLGDEPALAEFRAHLQTRADRVRRIAEFHHLSEQCERLVFAGDDDAIACGEEALQQLGVLDHAEWWNSLPADDLDPLQVERLRDEAYSMIILLAGIRAKQGVTAIVGPSAAPTSRAALNVLDAALRSRPDDDSAHTLEFFCRYTLGEQVHQLNPGEPSSAADYYFTGVLHLWIAQMPSDPISQLATRRARDLSGLDFKTPLATAERYLKTSVAMAPERFWANFWLGYVLAAANKCEASELAFNTCLSIRPASAWAYGMRAQVLLLQVRTAPKSPVREQTLRRALNDLKRAQAIEPHNPQIHLVRAYAFAALAQVPEVIAESLRFLEVEYPLRTKTGWNVLDQRNEFNRVQQLLKQVDASQANRPDTWAALARAHLDFEEPSEDDRALEATAHTLALKPGDPQARLVRGAVALRRKDLAKAVDDLQSAAAALPRDYLASVSLAWLSEAGGRWDEALSRFDQTLEITQTPWQRREAHQGRARALRRLGKLPEAKLADRSARVEGRGE
jgi:eukaryotic-like serine/threonine-protein kinase